MPLSGLEEGVSLQTQLPRSGLWGGRTPLPGVFLSPDLADRQLWVPQKWTSLPRAGPRGGITALMGEAGS